MLSGEIELRMATCSYRDFQPDMGVPVCTSIGRHKAFDHAEQCDPAKPWTTFRKMSDRPLQEQCARYQRQISENGHRVRARLEEIQRTYPGERLVLLCWCHLPAPDTGPMGCHRRWLADWFARNTQFTLPELGSLADTRPPELFGEQPTLF